MCNISAIKGFSKVSLWQNRTATKQILECYSKVVSRPKPLAPPVLNLTKR
jgi:hypothetical protein